MHPFNTVLPVNVPSLYVNSDGISVILQHIMNILVSC